MAQPLFAYRKHWAHRFGTAPFLPTTRAEMDELGWDACDVVLVTGDAYVDHPSFGMAIIGRLLEAHGFRVGILAQPDWRSAEPFRALGLAAGEDITAIRDVRGTAFTGARDGFVEIDSTSIDRPGPIAKLPDPYAMEEERKDAACATGAAAPAPLVQLKPRRAARRET